MKYKKVSYKGLQIDAYNRGLNMGLLIGLIGVLIVGIGNIIIQSGI